MNKQMKIAGVAPLIAIPTLLYLIITVTISISSNRTFMIAQSSYPVFEGIGVLLVLIGIIMVFNCARKLRISFNSGILMTDGLYRIFRNPMYASYLLFIIPGICFLFNSSLALSTIFINYILFTVFIRREHSYLEEKFGSEYKEYLKKVVIKFL